MDQINAYTCSCALGFTGSTCQQGKFVHGLSKTGNRPLSFSSFLCTFGVFPTNNSCQTKETIHFSFLNFLDLSGCYSFWPKRLRYAHALHVAVLRLSRSMVFTFSYRVCSAKFSRQKLGHAHDNSADSENVAGAPEPNVHAHFIFRFENGQGNQSWFFLSMIKYSWNESTTSSADGRLTRHRQGVSARPPAAMRKLGSARLSRKNRQTSWIVESFC